MAVSDNKLEDPALYIRLGPVRDQWMDGTWENPRETVLERDYCFGKGVCLPKCKQTRVFLFSCIVLESIAF